MNQSIIPLPTDHYLQQPRGMTNKYRVLGDTAIILLERPNGDVLPMMIDTADLPHVLTLPSRISAHPTPKRPDLVYAVCRPNGRSMSFHRWLTDAPDGSVIDHLNHNTLDQRRANLRITDHAGNMQNRRMKLWELQKGVLKSNRRERWAAFLWLGEFASAAQAERVYDEAQTILTQAGFWEWLNGAAAETDPRRRVDDAPAVYDWPDDTKRAS